MNTQFKYKNLLNVFCFFLFVSLLNSCATNTYPFSFYLDESSFKKDNGKVAIMPMNYYGDNSISHYKEFTKLIEDSIVVNLKKIGFEVICTKELTTTIDSIKLSCGNLYNPINGEPDSIAFIKFKIATNNYIFQKYKTSFILYPSMLFTEAVMNNSRISWHGRRVYNYFYRGLYGKFPALSLYIKVYNDKSNILFVNAGGIMPLFRLNFRTGMIQSIPFDELIFDPKDVEKSIKTSLKPIDVENKFGSKRKKFNY